MIEQQGGGDSASKGGEVRCNVVNRSDEPLIDDVGDGDKETTRECHGQQETYHGRILAEAASVQQSSELREAPRVLSDQSDCLHLPLIDLT